MSRSEADLLSHDAPPARASDASDRLRWALLLCWVVLLGYCVGFTDRPAPLDQLEAAVALGRVHTVHVGPPGVPAAGQGSGTQVVTWRHGLLRHRAEVEMTTRRGDASTPGSGSEDGELPIRRGRDLATQLRQHSPELQVVRVGMSRGLSDSEVYGWYVPQGVGLGALALILLTLLMLIKGPRPRWATRWAWFWLMATPVGTLLFLALAGPTPGLPAPKSPGPRLRGGWALVLAVLSSSLLPTWWTGA